MRKFGTCVVLAIAMWFGTAAKGQTSKGILAGTVRDKAGVVVASVKVTVTSEDTGETRTLTATTLGSYRAEGINPGLYKLHLEGAGFATADIKDIHVEPSVVTTFDPVLGAASVATEVTVEANTNAINTDNGHLSGTIDSQELADIPIFSLNPLELAAEIPGVQAVNPSLLTRFAEQANGGDYQQLIVNGARPRTNNYMLDGQDINDSTIGGQSFDPQVPDMYQTVTVLTNSASAEYGRSGGAVMNLVTKSGTNRFHGNAFELYSGSGLNSLDGVTREGTRKPPYPVGYVAPHKARYDQHQLGFTAGGPIWRDKLFAFGGTMFTRFYGESSSTSIVLPDANGYTVLKSIAGSATGSEASQIALMQGLLNNGSYLTSYSLLQDGTATVPYKTQRVSAANCAGGVACQVNLGVYQRPPVAQQQPETQWLYRIDFLPRTSDTFTVRYLHDRLNGTPDLALNTSGLPGFDAQVTAPTELGQGSWTHIFTPNLLNEFRASETRLRFLFSATPETLANPLAKNYNVSLTGSSLPVLGVSQSVPQARGEEFYQFQDAVGWTKGRHSIRFGADIGRMIESDLVPLNALGVLTFASGGGGLSALDNFLSNKLGTNGSLSKAFGPTRLDPHMWRMAGFFQDDIKLTSEFTLNLGMRYDYDTDPENILQYPAVSLTNPYAPINTVVPVHADLNNIAPRLGFAFNPHEGIFADGKTVFHGGFGVFYDTDFSSTVKDTAASSPDAPTTLVTSTTAAPVTNPSAVLAAATATLTPQSAVLSVASNLVNPITYQYNLGVEREIPGQIKLTLNYVGVRGEKLFANQQLNPYNNGARLNTARGQINVRDNAGDSHYNGGQLEVSRRFSHGLLFRATYVYSKDLDDTSEVYPLFSNPSSSFQANLQRIAQEYGPSSWDRRHVAAFEYIYSPVGFHSSNFAADLLLSTFTRHFILSGTTQLATGPYSNVQIIGLDTNNDLNNVNDRPLISNRNAPFATAAIDGGNISATFGIPAKTGVYYDMAAFNDPNTDLVPIDPSKVRFLLPYGPQYTTQEVGRDSYPNPGQSFWNMALEKDIPSQIPHIENGHFVMRAECENIGNHNNVSVLDTNLGDLGTTAFLNKSAARENSLRSFRFWGKFVF